MSEDMPLRALFSPREPTAASILPQSVAAQDADNQSGHDRAGRKTKEVRDF